VIRAILNVVAFEFQRSLTPGRLAAWALLWIFPTALVWMMRSVNGRTADDDRAAILAFYLVPQVSCMLGLLLWATPAVQSEMEGLSWVYLTVRPKGKLAAIFGKYALAVLWSASAGCIGAATVAYVFQGSEGYRLASVIAALCVLSCMAYGALYLLIGILFFRRPIVLAVAYTFFFEFILSQVPATINQLTVSYRLRSLLVHWMDLSEFGIVRAIAVGSEPWFWHVGYLIAYSGGLLLACGILIQWRPIPLQADP
jgi:hypothetical protein